MNTQTSKKSIAKMTLYFGTIIGLILLMLTSLWLNRVIFNTERFTDITVNAFSEPSSREAVGSLVASRVFENKPVLKATLSDRLSGYVSGLLASEAAKTSVNRLAREGQLLFTSPQKDPVILELSTLKPIIASAQELVQKDETQRRLNVGDIPDSITIVDTSELPNFHTAAVYVHIAGPLSLLAVLTLAGYWLYRGGKQNRYKRSQILMLVVIASAILAVIIGPLAEPSFISLGRDAPSQTLLGNLYREFITPFRNQALLLGSLATLTLVLTTAWHELNKRYSLTFKISKK
jgi:hypothetical protein